MASTDNLEIHINSIMYKKIENLEKENKELKTLNRKHKAINSSLVSTKDEIDKVIVENQGLVELKDKIRLYCSNENPTATTILKIILKHDNDMIKQIT
tara:strand:+ start:356 stop:649 length:294 start_codon:yes stop_codon:yes gene_type:complete